MSDLWQDILADIQTTYEYKCGYEKGRSDALTDVRDLLDTSLKDGECFKQLILLSIDRMKEGV